MSLSQEEAGWEATSAGSGSTTPTTCRHRLLSKRLRFLAEKWTELRPSGTYGGGTKAGTEPDDVPEQRGAPGVGEAGGTFLTPAEKINVLVTQLSSLCCGIVFR